MDPLKHTIKCPVTLDITTLKNHLPYDPGSFPLAVSPNRQLSSANGCSLYYHAADSVLTSGCSFISPQIWNDIFIVLAILSTCIMIEQLGAGKKSRFIYISSRQMCDLGTLSAMIVTGWGRWHLFWYRLFVSDLRRCTCSFAPPACPWILCCAILAE